MRSPEKLTTSTLMSEHTLWTWATLGSVKHVALCRVVSDGHGQSIKQPAGSLNDVEVSECNGVERPGVFFDGHRIYLGRVAGASR